MEIINFPDSHTDVIREIAVSPHRKNLVASGGFDGSVIVTDVGQAVRTIVDTSLQGSGVDNSIFHTLQVVGSVGWHPTHHLLASCTTDVGLMYFFDIRSDVSQRSRKSHAVDIGRYGLYTHAYLSEHELILGFGDGTMHLFDFRNQRSFSIFHDPHMQEIGEIRIGQASNFAVFGSPGFTLWRSSSQTLQLCNHDTLSIAPTAGASWPELYKTSGDFIPQTNLFTATDSCGMFSVYSA
eukprot:TRINITY_DN11652_c0_g2_i1.p1 TRINITY_DN11652_c0_g2~~TRINITY_DN11652_c0_g2_i1.p1  ORF type:complete len:277 (+),score=11.06 TRINITY_DN11652_c0_g2_i1:119-832(+)